MPQGGLLMMTTGQIVVGVVDHRGQANISFTSARSKKRMPLDDAARACRCA